jgi:hypothetical protein
MGQRRELRFKTLDDARAELKRLEKGTVITTSNWSYYQILTHLQSGSVCSMTSFPKLGSWWLRRFIGPIGLRKVFKQGFIPPGVGSTRIDPMEKGNEKKALASLRKTLVDLKKHEGPWAEHPFFGKMDKEKWLHLTALHLANHLGWAKLKTDKP